MWVMPDAVIPRTVNFPPDVYDAVDEYRRARGLKSWSKALLTIIAEWQAYRTDSRKGQKQ